MTGHTLQLDTFKILELPRDLLERIGGYLNSNERVCTLRLVNKAFAALHRGPGQRPVVRLSEPVPHHAFAACCTASSRAWIKALTFKRRVKLLCLTAASGDLMNLELAVGAAGCVLTGEVMGAAAAAGHLHVCLWLRQYGCPWGYALESAAKAGRWQVCEGLLASGCPGNPLDLRGAACSEAQAGHLSLVEWLRQHLPPGEVAATGHLLVAAVAHGGDLAALQRCYAAWWDARPQQAEEQEQQGAQGQGAQGEEGAGERSSPQVVILQAACSSRTPDWGEKVRWLEAHGCPRSDEVALWVVTHTPAEAVVERLRWLRERGYPLGEAAVRGATSRGNVAAAEFLLEEAGLDLDITFLAVKAGDLAALQGAHARGRRVNPRVCLWAAAGSGHLAIVSWLVDTFGLTTANHLQHRALWGAAESGNVELLDWLVGRGCDITRVWDGTVNWAARGGCEAMLERLMELGCGIPDDGAPYSSAARHGDLATLRCLRRLGCPWDPTGNLITEVIRENWPYCPLLPSLRLLVEAGCPVDWAEALKVLRGAPRWEDRAEVTGWLVEGLQRSRSRQGAGAVTRPTTGAGRVVGWLVGWLGLPSV